MPHLPRALQRDIQDMIESHQEQVSNRKRISERRILASAKKKGATGVELKQLKAELRNERMAKNEARHQRHLAAKRFSLAKRAEYEAAKKAGSLPD